MGIPLLSEIKNWSPEIEAQITSEWKAAEKFKFDAKKAKKIYSIDTPPPYINSPIHMGHATTYSFMDMTARYRRMKGFDVLFPLGMDRNGLPIEMAAEKKYNISAFKVSRDEFLAACEKLLKETSAESVDSFAKLGISFNSYKESNEIGAIYNTDSPEYRSVTQATFIDLYKKGLIYEDNRINNWDPKLRTTVADAEIDYKDLDSTFNHVIWTVKENNEKIIIATTRPELICTVGAVIYNPEDKRYQHLAGKTAISPIFKNEVKIMPHPFAKIDKGSGLVMMCAGGDLTDIQFFREQKMQAKIAVTQEGKMNELAGEFVGLKVREAREKTIEKLKELGLLIKQEQIKHSTPVSERSGAEIEFIEMPEFYLKQLDFKKDVEKVSKKINFYPKESKKILDSWINSVSIDWPITRRRFYATPVPLWHAEGHVAVPQQGEYLQPWKQSPPANCEIYKDGKKIGDMKNPIYSRMDWKGDIRVLDTWFDSSISELVMLKYKKDDEFFKKAYPATLRPQGKEIVRTWLYYTILRGFLETGQPCFKDTWIHQHILDMQGRKMSKSLGNIIDPQEIMKEYGAEALRFWSAIEGDLSKQDISCSKDKIKAELKTMNKLLNVSKFILQFKKPEKKPKLTKLDLLFIEKINDIISKADKSYENYDFHNPALELRAFLWDIYASQYIEIVKNRAYNQENKFTESESDSAKYTLYYILQQMMYLLYPIIPQITSVIATDLGIDLHSAEFPKAEKADKKSISIIDKISEFNSQVWKAKREKNISLKEPISGIEVPKKLKEFEKDLKACHNLL